MPPPRGMPAPGPFYPRGPPISRASTAPRESAHFNSRGSLRSLTAVGRRYERIATRRRPSRRFEHVTLLPPRSSILDDCAHIAKPSHARQQRACATREPRRHVSAPLALVWRQIVNFPANTRRVPSGLERVS